MREDRMPQNFQHWFTTFFLPGGAGKRGLECKLQALVYNIFPSTTAIVDYAMGLEELSANEPFFNDDQTAVSL